MQIIHEQDTLRAGEEYFRSLIENSSDLIYVLDMNGRIQYASPSVERSLGYTIKELEGRDILDFIDRVDTALFLGTLENARISAGATQPPVEIRFRHVRGSWLYHEIIGKSVPGQSGQISFVVNARDNTSKRNDAVELQQSLSKLKETLGAIIQAMVATVEARDPYTAGHQKRVAGLAAAIAKRMGLTKDKINALEMAGAIHDLGKISVPAEILSTPRKLTSIELNIIKTHPTTGYDILKDIDFPWPIARIVLQHHERLNGTGYPFALKGPEILMEAKIIALADVVEAISSDRPYRPALGIDVALGEIERDMGTLYDELVTKACLQLFRDEGFAFDN
ncbi:MAG TPA: HD domain-containing phosphohydrolase [Syntrophorhabdaceae bacterium]|nr:HD domain-containing phosphohydrolase [Syntrophorhabdaceae bacterium]